MQKSGKMYVKTNKNAGILKFSSKRHMAFYKAYKLRNYAFCAFEPNNKIVNMAKQHSLK